MPASPVPPPTTASAPPPTGQDFYTKWFQKFVDNDLEGITYAMFQELFADMRNTFATWRELRAQRVKGAPYPMPFTDSLNQIPAAYRILGMTATARVGLSQADATAAGSATWAQHPPVSYYLLRDSSGPVNALLDEEATTTATVAARWVLASGTDEEITDSFPPFVTEDRTPNYKAGDRFSYEFPSGEKRLFEVRNNLTTYVNPLPTGEDDDPHYVPYAPRRAGSDYDDTELQTRLAALEAKRQVWEYIGEPAYNNTAQGLSVWGPPTYGTGFSNNIFGWNTTNATFGDNCSDNQFFGNCYANAFGNGCSANRFFAVGSSTFGENFVNGVVENCEYVQVGDNCPNVALYHCKGTASDPFVVPTGTVDAVYRHNQLQPAVPQATDTDEKNLLAGRYVVSAAGVVRTYAAGGAALNSAIQSLTAGETFSFAHGGIQTSAYAGLGRVFVGVTVLGNGFTWTLDGTNLGPVCFENCKVYRLNLKGVSSANRGTLNSYRSRFYQCSAENLYVGNLNNGSSNPLTAETTFFWVDSRATNLTFVDGTRTELFGDATLTNYATVTTGGLPGTNRVVFPLRTVNGLAPDAAGNVAVSAGDGPDDPDIHTTTPGSRKTGPDVYVTPRTAVLTQYIDNVAGLKIQVSYRDGNNAWQYGLIRTAEADANADLAAVPADAWARGVQLRYETVPVDATKEAQFLTNVS